MKLMPVLKYAEQQGVGTEGQTLFIQNIPERAGTPAVMFKHSLDGTPIDYELPGLRKGKFQAVVRCKANKFVDGEALAALLSDTLTIKETALDGMYVKFIRPLHEPVAYQLSDGANYEFSVNFKAVYVIV